MRLNDYLDVLIPRGGANLIKTVLTTATVPVIETGTGNCHIYVDKDAQLTMATEIIVNAKCQRPSVCNAAETLLIHQEVAESFLPTIEKALKEFHVELRADERALAIFEESIPATEQDWETEFLDFILAVKVVDSLDEAIQHINRYNTKHSESIISDNYFATQQFYNKWMQPLFMRMLQLVSRTVLNLDLAPKSALVRKITCPWTYGLSRAYFDKICYLWNGQLSEKPLI